MPDDEQNRFGRSLGEGYSYVALGFTFAVAILAFGALGWVVDGWLGTRPWFALVGAAIGGVGGGVTNLFFRGAGTEGGNRAPPPRALGWGGGGGGGGLGGGGGGRGAGRGGGVGRAPARG